MTEKPNSPIPSRESVCGFQVQVLLNIVHVLSPLALVREGGEVGKSTPEFDGGVEAAVSVTLMAVCDRLTEIAKDNTRWSMAGQDKLENSLTAMWDENTKLLAASRYAQALHSSPMSQFKPTIGKTPDGKFFAVYGDINKPGTYVLGTGETLKQAIEDYNKQFGLAAKDQNTLVPDKHPNFTKGRKPKRK